MIFDMVKKALLAGLGVQQSVQNFLDDLVKKGELSDGDAAKLLKDWINKTEESAQELEKKINEGLSKTLSVMNLPSRQDISRLEKQIEDLSKLLRASKS